MTFESIIKRVKSIPPLPISVVKVEKLFTQRDPSLNELVKIVEEDSILTADILAIVNSPLYSFSKNIVSIHQAITLFGMHKVRGFILSSLASNTFNLDMSPYGLNNEEFQKISSLQSSLMFQWYMGVDVQQANILVPIAFLMDTGKIIIANEVSHSDYKDEFRTMIQSDDSIIETEKLFTGVSSAEATALLFNHWNFNEIFSNVIKDSDKPSDADNEYKQLCQAIDIVKSCINVKDIMTESSINLAKEKVLRYGFNLNKFTHTIQRIQDKLSSSVT